MNSKAISNAVIVLCLFFAASVSVLSDALNVIALYMAIPLAFLLSFIKCERIAPNRYMVFLLLLYAWDGLSSLWALYPATANVELKRILGAFLLTYIVAVNGTERSMLKYLYIMFIILYIGAWIYSSQNGLIMAEIAGNTERLNDAKLNANTMAYYTFYVTFACFCLSSVIDSAFWSRLCMCLFLAMIPLSFYVALVTASRQVLLIQIPLISFLLFERYYRQAGRKIRMLFVAISVVVVLLVAQRIIDIYDNSYLATRAQTDISEDSRSKLLWDAINVGLNHFPLGVGAGNYRNYSYKGAFSHCSYTELFANNGVVGLALYVCLIYRFFKLQWERYRYTHDRQFMIFLFFGLMFAFYQFFYVFYTDLWLIAFFVLIAAHADLYYEDLLQSEYVSDSNPISLCTSYTSIPPWQEGA